MMYAPQYRNIQIKNWIQKKKKKVTQNTFHILAVMLTNVLCSYAKDKEFKVFISNNYAYTLTLQWSPISSLKQGETKEISITAFPPVLWYLLKSTGLKEGLNNFNTIKSVSFLKMCFFIVPVLTSASYHGGRRAKKGGLPRGLDNTILFSPKFWDNKLGDTIACLIKRHGCAFPLYTVQRM